MREGGEALHCGNWPLAVVVVAHLYPHLASRHLAAIWRDDDCFCRLQLWFVMNILQNKFLFDPEVSRTNNSITAF